MHDYAVGKKTDDYSLTYNKVTKLLIYDLIVSRLKVMEGWLMNKMKNDQIINKPPKVTVQCGPHLYWASRVISVVNTCQIDSLNKDKM